MRGLHSLLHNTIYVPWLNTCGMSWRTFQWLWNMPSLPRGNRKRREIVVNVVIAEAGNCTVNEVDSGSHRQLVITRLVCLITTCEVMSSGYWQQLQGRTTRRKVLPHERAQWIQELGRRHDLFDWLGAFLHRNTRTCDEIRRRLIKREF